MELFKKIAFKVLLLALMMLALNFIYEYFFFEKDIQKHSDVINLVREMPDETEILYIGESSNITSRSDDIDKRPISAFIADYYPGLKLYDITKPASHAGIYKVLLENIPKSAKVKTVIVTLNLRSFDASWIYSDLETALQKSMVLIRTYPPFVNRFLLSFKAYDIKTEKERELQFKEKWEKDELVFPYPFSHKNVIEWDSWMANTGIKDSTGNIDYPKTELACHFIKTYGFQIDTLRNPRIKDFDDIIKLAEKRGWNLVFNLLAENTEKAQQLVGDDIVYLMHENRNILLKYFQKYNITIVDNLDAVESGQYVDQNWTTEHYAEKGRKTIARNVALGLKHYYPEQFVEADYSIKVQTKFFNNCDENVIWGQMQTITNEIVFSGKSSSKTGDGNNFSITFEYPLKALPDSSKNLISIKFKAYQETLNKEAKLVVQTEEAGKPDYWNGFDLNWQIHQTKTWEDFQYIFTFPDSIKQAYLIKIYVFNPSNEKVFIDDFSIEFQKK